MRQPPEAGAPSAADPPPPRHPHPQAQPQRPDVYAGPLRVLLIEDDEGDAVLARELLDEAGAEVELAVVASLAEAENSLDGVECVLLDLGLPDAQGLSGLRRLVSVAGSAAICVLTGMGDEHLGAAAVAEGAQDYLIKGQVTGVLLARALRYAVERKRADENARRLREVELLQKESRRLQRGLLPQPLLHGDGVVVHKFYRPGRHSALLGGDFYDVVQTGPERVEVMVGDVCGNDVDQAALGVELRVAWRALVLAGVPGDAVLPALEQVLVSERRGEEIFATLAMVTVELGSGEAAVRLAGHPPPLLLSGGAATVVPAGYGPLLGVFEHAQRPVSRVRFDGDDWCLLMYTDGLIEGRAGDGAARLNIAGLCELITSPAGQAVTRAELAPWLVARAEEANGGPLADDVAMLVLGGLEPDR